MSYWHITCTSLGQPRRGLGRRQGELAVPDRVGEGVALNHRHSPLGAIIFALGTLFALAGTAEAKPPTLFGKDADEDGIRDRRDRCPNTKEDLNGIDDEDGCPDDADSDGVANAADRCPRTPEDMNGYEDDDGCPDDSDTDGIPNFVDRCPLLKGGAEDGCPEKQEPVAEKKAPEPTPVVPLRPVAYPMPFVPYAFDSVPAMRFDPILFKVGSDSIADMPDSITPRPQSRAEQLLRILLARPELKVYLVGHASYEGSQDENLRLSQRRADAIRTYLLSHGVTADRVVDVVGKGTELPYDQGASSAARRLNRRVEVYLSVDGTPVPQIQGAGTSATITPAVAPAPEKKEQQVVASPTPVAKPRVEPSQAASSSEEQVLAPEGGPEEAH
jgi:outer membrane protein OmpA-like peptidoglycan-associated protein